jgi:hypothetical protein
MMNKQYHIPVPKLDPGESDCQWVMENIAPRLYPALDIIKGAFDRVDIPQTAFIGWPQRDAILAHFDELEIKVRRFACFIGHPHNATRTAHVDAYVRGVPMIARFNIPVQGRSPASISWWNDTVDSDKFYVREFTELRNGQERAAYSYSSTIPDWGDTPEYTVYNPGTCWNRTELAHRPWAGECAVPRILITTETAEQISWAELVSRLERRGYC